MADKPTGHILTTPQDFMRERCVALELCHERKFDHMFIPPVPPWLASAGWEPEPDEYCPVTFDDNVPSMLSIDCPIVMTHNTLWVYGHDGQVSHYFKYRLAKWRTTERVTFVTSERIQK